MAEFDHQTALAEYEFEVRKLPTGIRNMVYEFEKRKAKVYADPDNIDPAAERNLVAYSATISDQLHQYYQRDFAEEQEQENQSNQNNMLTGELLKRAQAVGLTETATEADVVAAEAKKKEADDAAEADRKKQEEETAAAKKKEEEEGADAAKKKQEEETAAAKKKEEETAAAKKKAEADNDIMDDLDI